MVDDVRLLAARFVALSGVHVSGVQRVRCSTRVRCPVCERPVSACVMSASARSAPWWFVERVGRGQTALGSAGRGRRGPPSMLGRRLRERFVSPAGLAQESAGGRLVLAARSRLEAEGTRPDPARAGGLGLLVGEECLASYQTLSWEWIGCGDYAQWSSREASGRAAWSLRAFPAGLRRELAAALRPQHAVSAARSKLTTP